METWLRYNKHIVLPLIHRTENNVLPSLNEILYGDNLIFTQSSRLISVCFIICSLDVDI